MNSDPELDFTSPQFNPAKALSTLQLKPPVASARPLDNIRKFRPLLPTSHPDHLAAGYQAEPGAPSQTAKAKELQQQRVSYVQQIQQRKRTNPIADIAARITDGPFVLLKQLFEQRLKVRVVLKHDKGIRGVATGTLVAFDKHMNLVLKDVEEMYTVLLSIERTTASGKTRACRKQEKRRRQLKQVFIKGTSVVMVGRAVA